MILFNEKQSEKLANRPSRILQLCIDEKPQRRVYQIKTDRARQKFIKQVEAECRRSEEYKTQMKFLKTKTDFNKCIVLKKMLPGGAGKYTIEMHHHPFTLFDICHTVLRKREEMGERIRPADIAEEVMKLHYDGEVGLIPLSVTIHELYHDGQIFIPIQWVYQNYSAFVDKYDSFIPKMTVDKIEYMYQLSLKCENIMSDVLSPEFVYIEIDGFNFPTVPEEWGELLRSADYENMKFEKENELNKQK